MDAEISSTIEVRDPEEAPSPSPGSQEGAGATSLDRLVGGGGISSFSGIRAQSLI